MQYIIEYRGVLTKMYVTGFSEPMIVDGGNSERSVKASSSPMAARLFDEDEVDGALALTRRCHPDAAASAK